MLLRPPPPVKKPSLLILPARRRGRRGGLCGRRRREPSVLHSAAGVMLGFLSRGCGERVSLSHGPVLNNKWPANRQTSPRTATPGGVAPTLRDKRRGQGAGEGEGPRPLVWRTRHERGIRSHRVELHFSLYFSPKKKKKACWDHARQSPSGAKQAHSPETELCAPSLRGREKKERRIKLRAVQHFQRCQAR